jgi:APA family basic amino acid/polyamine antiporter
MNSPMTQSSPLQPFKPHLEKQIGLFDATMIVMGGVVGAGIFMNPYVVAQRLHSPALILSVWVVGGIVAILGAFIYAELGDRLPQVGGQYVYLRDAYHPAVGFLYGWVLLLVIQTGGMAAVTVTFARYFLELTNLPLSEHWISFITLALLTIINCLGVKPGSRVQSILMILKIVAISCLVGAGLFFLQKPQPLMHPFLDRPVSFDLLTAIGAALVPVLFSYGGWQTTNFIASEIKDPRKNLGRALIIGVFGVVTLYLLVNLVCVRTLGAAALADTRAPASAVMRMIAGERGAKLIAIGIAISAVGFLSQSILTGPRVYFAMADDGLFFRSVAYVTQKTKVPAIAIILQSIWTGVVVLTGKYEQILNYVICMDFLFIGLSATTLFVFRRRERQSSQTIVNNSTGFRVPGHPVTTIIFVATCWLVVANTIYKYPHDTSIGILILFLGLPVYLYWRRRQRTA